MESAEKLTKAKRKRSVRTGRRLPSKRAAKAAIQAAAPEGERDRADRIAAAKRRPVDWSILDQVTARIRAGAPLRAAHSGLVSESLMARWIADDEEVAFAVQKALFEQLEMFRAQLEAAPAGVWQKWAWLLERQHPHIYSQRAQVQVDSRTQITVDVSVCQQMSEAWERFRVFDAEVVDKTSADSGD